MAAPVDIKKVFDEIATKYHWEDKVRDYMLAREGLGAEKMKDSCSGGHRRGLRDSSSG